MVGSAVSRAATGRVGRRPAASAVVVEAGREDDPTPIETSLDPAGQAQRRLVAPHEAVHRRAPGRLAGPRRAAGQEIVDELRPPGRGRSVSPCTGRNISPTSRWISVRPDPKVVRSSSTSAGRRTIRIRCATRPASSAGGGGRLRKASSSAGPLNPARDVGYRQDAAPVGGHGATEQERRRPVARDASAPLREGSRPARTPRSRWRSAGHGPWPPPAPARRRADRKARPVPGPWPGRAESPIPAPSARGSRDGRGAMLRPSMSCRSRKRRA